MRKRPHDDLGTDPRGVAHGYGNDRLRHVAPSASP
jgi:hypothetical protein